MSFPRAWLQLRERFDHAARDAALAERFASDLPGRPSILELGAGLGSGLRWLAPRLQQNASWVLVDHDPELLAAAPEVIERWARGRGLTIGDGDGELALRTSCLDIRDLGGLPTDVDAVTCQALLDLASHDWLEAFAEWLASHRLPLLAALTVDGRVRWEPPIPLDDEVQAAFRLHQLGDRGFGASPGWRAADQLADLLRIRGYRVRTAPADWRIAPHHPRMLQEMVRGTAHAAREVHPRPARVDRWQAERLQAVDDGALGLVVGHLDLLALPA